MGDCVEIGRGRIGVFFNGYIVRFFGECVEMFFGWVEWSGGFFRVIDFMMVRVYWWVVNNNDLYLNYVSIFVYIWKGREN